jgi:hypothetical protein
MSSRLVDKTVSTYRDYRNADEQMNERLVVLEGLKMKIKDTAKVLTQDISSSR